MNCVLVFPTRFLFKTYFCWKIYLNLFFLCFYTVSSLAVIVCLMNESEITHFMKPFPTMGGDRNLNVCFECEKYFNTQNFFQIIKIKRNIVCLLLPFHKQGGGNTSFRNHVNFRFTISRKEKTKFTISRKEKNRNSWITQKCQFQDFTQRKNSFHDFTQRKNVIHVFTKTYWSPLGR